MYDNPAYVTLQPYPYIFLQLGKMGQKPEVKSKKTKQTNIGISRQAGGMQSAYFILGNTFVPRSGGGGGGGVG